MDKQIEKVINGERDWCVIQGDCFEIMKTIPIDKIDLCFTDPPYGIGWDCHLPDHINYGKIIGDEKEPDLHFLLNLPCNIVSFGANYYPSQLPHRGRWICWDKRLTVETDKMLGSSFELAWTNKASGFNKIYRILHGGVVNDDGINKKRLHPTQKPVSLFLAILKDYPACNIILDPFCGSGTTIIAALKLGRRAIGIEIDPKYVEIAKARVAASFKCGIDTDNYGGTTSKKKVVDLFE